MCVSVSAVVTPMKGGIVVELRKNGLVRDERGRSKLITHVKAPGFLTITFFALFITFNSVVIGMVKA